MSVTKLIWINCDYPSYTCELIEWYLIANVSFDDDFGWYKKSWRFTQVWELYDWLYHPGYIKCDVSNGINSPCFPMKFYDHFSIMIYGWLKMICAVLWIELNDWTSVIMMECDHCCGCVIYLLIQWWDCAMKFCFSIMISCVIIGHGSFI